jgi:hypothetical protein
MLLTLVLLAQAVGGAAGEEAGDPGAGVRRRTPCATVEVVSPQGLPGRSGFSATQILDLELRAFVRPLRGGPHLLELKVYTPRGHLYQVLPVAFEGSGGAASFVRVGGAVRQRVVATLPVAGTAIVTTSLYGRWTAAVHLDGATESCATPVSFRLVP